MKAFNHTYLCLLLALPFGPAVASHSEDSPDPTSLHVLSDSRARDILKAVPEEGALERFEVLMDNGTLVSYVGLTEGDIGGVVFVNSTLLGTLDRSLAQAFYSCRGYATARNQYWAQHASEWSNSLIAAVTPAADVQLQFSGKSSMQSIKAVIAHPLVGQVKALVDMGTNPLNIVKTLSRARENQRERERTQQMQLDLDNVAPGATEDQLAKMCAPEDVTFLEDSIVMAYPKYSVEFLVADSKVTVIQQPSFHQLARERAALFYNKGLDWGKCTPDNWKNAVKKAETTL